MLYMALTLYAIIFLFTWMLLLSMIDEVCENIHTELNQEIGRRRLAGEKLDHQLMRELSAVMISNFRKYSRRHSVIQNLWMCFLLIPCTFFASRDFEEDFKREFKSSALLELLEAFDASTNTNASAFTEIVRAVSYMSQK